MAGDIPGAPTTLENTARSIIASFGNDSPNQTQLVGMEAWILAEKPSGWPNTTDAYGNNPLNVTKGGSSAFPNIPFSVPDPTQNNGNPVLQFPDITSGIAANAAFIKTWQPQLGTFFADPHNALGPGTFAQALNGHWGTSPALFLEKFNELIGGSIDPTVPGNPSPGTPSGTIGVSDSGKTGGGTDLSHGVSGPTTPDQCQLKGTGPKGITTPGDIGDYVNCLFNTTVKDVEGGLIRFAGYAVGALFLIIGIVIFFAGDISIKGVSLKDAGKKMDQ